HVYETLTLTEKDMPSPYSFFEILSANGKSVITTTVDLDASRFTEASDNLWVYQLAKKNGIYPAFRYLYVDGERAEIAHATGESDEDTDIQVMGFPRTYDGIYSRVKALYEAGTLTSDTKSGYPAARTDLNQKFEAYKAMFLAASSADEVPAPDVIAEGKMYFPLTAVDKHGSSGVVTGLSSEAYMAMQWYFNIVRIVKIDFDDTATDESGNTHVACYFDLEEYQYFYEQSGHVNTGRYVCLFNDPLYLDEEGEMYYDRETGKVYYYTEEDLTKKRVERPTLDYLLKLENVKNVSFTDISFTGLDDYHMSENPTCFHLGGLDHMTSTDTITYAYDRSALYLGNVENVTLYDCRFYQLPAKAIQAQGVVNGLTVEACSFENLGGNGIYFGHGRTVWDDDTQCENATVTDCYFGGIGQVYRNSAAIFFTVLKDGRILNNTIEDCAYTAISVGFSYSAKAARPSDKTFYNLYNVEIAYNYITDFMTELGDGAAIYVAGGNSDNDDTRYFNEMHHNYVVMSNRTGNGVGHMVVGLYFDGATSNWRCYNNVIAEHSYGAFAGEDDWLLAEGDPYVTELRNRATDCYYIYLQYIKGQEAWNILCQNNIILNVRATDPKKQEEEVFSTLVKSERNLFAEGTVYSNGVSRIPPSAEEIAYAAGCYGHYGDPSCLGGNDY
ncbi:MAG: right-handed parallel beta-helix repeat-containing protein, partial [Clostridia bacterium]|nr:right-handed parallel beta-helix repeat-containing protein [Clostridia bacterium]